MMYRSRDSSEKRDRTKAELLFAVVSAFVLLIVFRAVPGTYVQSQFAVQDDGINDSNVAMTDSGLGLAIKYRETIKLFGDSVPASVNTSNYTDIVASVKDTFVFFYVDSIDKSVFYTKVKLNMTNATPVAPRRFCDISPPIDCYLHADRGSDGFLVSFVNRVNITKRTLVLNNGVCSLSIDSVINTGWLFPSQCHMEKDTFLVVNSVDAKRVVLRKVYSSGDKIKVVGTAEVATDAGVAGAFLLNCSVSYDNVGNILVAWTRGSPNGDKYINYRFFSRNLTGGPTGSFPEKAGDRAFSFYDDAGIAPYGEGRFAVAFWNASGIFLHRLEIDDGHVEQIPKQISDKAGARFCAAASNSQFLIVAVKGDLDNSGVVSVEGFRYPIKGKILEAPEFFVYSDPDVSVDTTDRYKSAINCAIDSSGNFGVTWSSNLQAKGSLRGTIFGYRGVRFSKGFWTSPVESVTVPEGDSVRFYPGIVDVSTLSDWYMLDSIRIGSTAANCRNQPWISMHDSTALARIQGESRYFQYRMEINRRTDIAADTLTTPVVRSVNVPWNGQPSFSRIDSVIAGSRVYRNISFGDTVSCLSRSDTARIYVDLFDPDTADTLVLTGTSPALNNALKLTYASGFNSSITLRPTVKSDTVVVCTLKAVDSKQWEAVPRTLTIVTRNTIPLLNANMAYTSSTGYRDTVTFGGGVYDLQEDDSLEFFYSVSDTNDQSAVRGMVLTGSTGGTQKVDSTGMGKLKRFVIRGDTLSIVDSFLVTISARDQDTTVSLKTKFYNNHLPRIINLTVGGEEISEGEVLRVIPGAEIAVFTAVSDTDCVFWDTLTYHFSSGKEVYNASSGKNSFSHKFRPLRGDSLVTVTVHDRFGRADTVRFSIRYPWFSVDTSDYIAAADSLERSVSLIVGSAERDSIVLPLVNSGSDTMSLTGIKFRQKSSDWLSIRLPQDTLTKSFTSRNASSMVPILMRPGNPVYFKFAFTTEKLLGDGMLCDTIILLSSDPQHPSDTIPVCLEYNDLPRVVSVAPDFIAGVPYQPLKKAARPPAYSFPPHASIQISFSEPMDTSLTRKGIYLYSAIDSQFTGRQNRIGFSYRWSQNNTKVNLTASYEKASPGFGFFPPEGLFIPTDSLVVVMTTDLADIASTPNGPNRLDVNKDNRRDKDALTKSGMKVDSIGFSLLNNMPLPGDTLLGLKPEITLVFSSPVFVTSIDTSLTNNRCLIVNSKYNNGRQLSFDSIKVSSNKVTFRIAGRLFYRDSLWCTYRGIGARDLMGFPADNDLDGVPTTLFDSSSTREDISWGYRVKGIEVTSISPAGGTVFGNRSPAVTISFSERLLPGIIDTDTSGQNASFSMSTLFSGERSAFGAIEFSRDSLSVTFHPTISFFSGDVINCKFSGFASDYLYSRTLNYPSNPTSVFCDKEWEYSSKMVGFYTYPNPYKPGKDPRHCRNAGPCGIWFKNLHNLKPVSTDLIIKIYNTNSHPVFDTRKAGQRVRVESGNSLFKPQWHWDTRNQAGELVASGIYLYSISNTEGKVLVKGKMVIVR